MNINFSKTSHVFFFGGFIPFISWQLSNYLQSIFPNWPNWLEGLSPLFIYGVIFYLFDEYFWKLDFFKFLGIVWFPNINGRWTGKQISSYKEDNKNIESVGIIEIKQTFSKISIQAYYSKSSSESVTANFAELNNKVYLFYTYDNDPNSLKSGTMQKHRGTVKLKFNLVENTLTGSYWNSIKNSGEMEFNFVDSKLLGRS